MAYIKCKYKDITDIFEWSEKFGDEKVRDLIGTQPSVHEVAYYTPSQANWSYILGLVEYEGEYFEVITVFGEVRAARLVNIPKYDKAELDARRF